MDPLQPNRRLAPGLRAPGRDQRAWPRGSLPRLKWCKSEKRGSVGPLPGSGGVLQRVCTEGRTSALTACEPPEGRGRACAGAARGRFRDDNYILTIIRYLSFPLSREEHVYRGQKKGREEP